MTKKEEFLTRFNIDEETGCWIWVGISQKNVDGYGYFGTGLAHRASYELFKGKIPVDMFVLHKCPCGADKRCVNPDHLKLGTAKENTEDWRRTKERCFRTLKLTESESDEICRLYFEEGLTQCIIAKKLNTNQSAVSKIVNGSMNFCDSR